VKQPRPVGDVNRGAWLRSIRKALGLNQAALAEKLGVQRTTVSAWENGDYKPSAEVLMAMGNIAASSGECSDEECFALFEQAGGDAGKWAARFAARLSRVPSREGPK
jgi:transcriptional regulator with XRE-family HTH domain